MFKKGTVLFTTFDEYEILEQVGQGGSATVFKARNNDGEVVAIKAIEKNKTTKDKLKRFKNEIEFCRKNKNKNIIEVLDNGTFINEKNDCIFYVMPLYSETLRERIESEIAPMDAIKILFNILYGVEFAHKHNAFHRDIKPENILFQENSNEAVLADFGIAHFASEDLITAVETKHTDRLANFQYASPEQRIRNGVVDGRSDVFAIGLILNEMFTKQIVSGVKFKRIADVNPTYGYLDLLFDKMTCQNQADRLYPIDKILLELKVLTDKNQNELELKELSSRKITAEIANNNFPTPKVVNIDYSKNTLSLFLEPPVPREWMNIFRSSSYSHGAIYGKGPETFVASQSGNEIHVNLSSDDENIIIQIVKYFKEWLIAVTSIYNQKNKNRIIQEQQAKEAVRVKAIQEKEREIRVKSSLKDLL